MHVCRLRGPTRLGSRCIHLVVCCARCQDWHRLAQQTERATKGGTCVDVRKSSTSYKKVNRNRGRFRAAFFFCVYSSGSVGRNRLRWQRGLTHGAGQRCMHLVVCCACCQDWHRLAQQTARATKGGTCVDVRKSSTSYKKVNRNRGRFCAAFFYRVYSSSSVGRNRLRWQRGLTRGPGQRCIQ